MPSTPSRPAPARSRAAARALAYALVLAVGGLGLAGCSADSGSSRVAAGAAASASPGPTSMDAYRQCLTQHGVTAPPRPRGSGRPSDGPRGSGGDNSGSDGSSGWGGSGGTGRSGGAGGWAGGAGGGRGAAADPKRRAAVQACASLRPQFGGRAGGPGGSAMKAFTSCLKDHGVVLPSPAPNTRGPRSLPTTDPKSAQAYATCKALLPQGADRARRPTPSRTA
ncbi:hypothetical protein [Streptomyces sp. NPDC089919]|uniref:hypothetical protein n=1 Tax=Streptomyces sp. NPDC089919 TaxID=3155188 RepID=UPI003420E573